MSYQSFSSKSVIAAQAARIAELEALLSKSESQTNQLQSRNQELQSQLEWFRRQIFGQKSERRAVTETCSGQLWLGEQFKEESQPPEEARTVKEHTRKKRKAKKNACGDISRLQFDERAQVIDIELPDPKVEDGAALKLIGTDTTYRLAQVQGPYVVLRYQQKTFKVTTTSQIISTPVPTQVIERSFADVSFLAGMAVEKTVYHVPIHRQHEKLKASGIQVSRSTLTGLYHKTAELLEPIYFALLSSLLCSSVIFVDQTNTKAQRAKGKMVPASYWGLMNLAGEVAFVFSGNRSGKFIETLLEDFSGTVISDGELDYARFVATKQYVRHAFCWIHVRRYFLKAEKEDPAVVNHILYLLRRIYRIERRIKDAPPDFRERVRRRWSKALVDRFFGFIKQVACTKALLPSQNLMKAISYTMTREQGLRVFLDDQSVAPDTNALERMFRPHAVGRKNWLFHMTQRGARYTGIFYSLVQSCRLNDVDPYQYLIDVLQRIDSHPVREVHLLTPANWKQHFQANPLRSDLQRN